MVRRRVVHRALLASGLVSLVVAAELATYPLWRRRCLTWGATDEEAAAELAGDEFLENPDIVATRAVWVDAPPSAVWPWLVQMGPGRGGLYTYDWIENLLGLDVHSVDRILPEYQDTEVGYAQRLGEQGPVLRVARLDAPSAMVLRSDDEHWVWAFCLSAAGGGTRLVSRNRIALGAAPLVARAFATFVMEPGSLVMERKMLLGIKARAERLAADQVPASA